MTATPPRAPRRSTRRTVVKPRCNPGRALYRNVTRKQGAVKIEEMPDVELLRVLISERAAAGIVEHLEPHGGLRGFWKLCEGGPRALLNIPGVDEGTAARLMVLWELAARISEPYRGE
ncbi:hypothetical protein ACFFLM_21200 [Deinococcus oregonensis]|uniref:Uncharacterized protein n=1 Tax=Deinococcus oregonensis TaxID=1805970 RepID=A0ABV6B5J6_9DEIO